MKYIRIWIFDFVFSLLGMVIVAALGALVGAIGGMLVMWALSCAGAFGCRISGWGMLIGRLMGGFWGIVVGSTVGAAMGVMRESGERNYEYLVEKSAPSSSRPSGARFITRSLFQTRKGYRVMTLLGAVAGTVLGFVFWVVTFREYPIPDGRR